MTMKALLGTAAVALVLGVTPALAQSAISLGHLADYSGATSDVQKQLAIPIGGAEGAGCSFPGPHQSPYL